MIKLILFFIVLFTLLHITATQSYAVSEPSLFSCRSPIGSTLANFNEGTHGIAGDSATYTGSDRVYKIDSDHVVQCFCPSDSNDGIQSNWFKLSDNNQNAIAYYQKLGWIYVPSGKAWGLDDAAYIVKNESYSCHGDAGGGGSTLGISSSDPGKILGKSRSIGSILGTDTLAATGNDKMIALYVFFGFSSALIAYKLAQE